MNLYKEGVKELKEAQDILQEAKLEFNEIKNEEINEEE